MKKLTKNELKQLKDLLNKLSENELKFSGYELLNIIDLHLCIIGYDELLEKLQDLKKS